MAFDLSSAKPVDSEPKGGFDLSTATPVTETGGGAALITPKQRATPSRPETRKAAEAIAESTLGGAVSGGVAPYAMMAGGAALAGTPFAPVGAGLMEMGSMMKAQGLAANVGLGALSGLGEEAAGQFAKSKGASEAVQEASRLAGGVITPEFGNLIRTGLSKIGGAVYKTSEDLASALIKDLDKGGTPEKNLTPTQRQFIKDAAREFVGSVPKEKPEKSVYSALEKGSEQIVDRYNSQAKQLEQQAKDIVDSAKLTAQGKTAEAQAKADRLQSQFENSAKQLLDTAQQRSNSILANARKQADQIRSYAAKESPSVRQIQEIDARDVITKGQQEAQKVISDAQTQVNRLRSVAEKSRVSGAGALERGKQALSSVGQALRPSELITKARESIEPLIEDLKYKRQLNAEATKADAFNFAFMKEKSGQKAADTNAFKSLMTQIDNSIKNPVTKLTNVSVPEMKTQLNQIKRALDPREEIDGTIVGNPVSFQGLENLRRFLRDRAMGMDVQGYDAIDKIQAGKLAEGVENIMKEFSPGVEIYLQRYKADSEPLRVIQSKVGESLLSKEDFDFSRYAESGAQVGKKIFLSEQSVKDFIELLGKDPNKAEPFARSFIADSLRNADSKAVANKINEWRDWLPQFPKLQQDLSNAQATMAQAERTGAKRTSLSDLLRTKALPLVPTAKTTAEDILAKSGKSAQDIRRKAAEQEQKFLSEQYKTATGLEEAAQAPAGQVMTEAQKQAEASAKSVAKQKADLLAQAQAEGKAGISEAEKQAGGLTRQAGQLSAQGEQIKNEILGKAFDVNRVQQVILSGNPILWKEVGPIIANDPVAKDNLYKALKNTISQTAETSPSNLVRAWNLNIKPAMESTGLLTPKQLAETNAFMNSLERTVEGKNTLNLWKRALINTLTAETGRGLGYLTQPFGFLGQK